MSIERRLPGGELLGRERVALVRLLAADNPGARGDDGKVQPLDVKVGDRVLFGKWSGNEIKIDGEELIIMKETDIMGIIAN